MGIVLDPVYSLEVPSPPPVFDLVTTNPTPPKRSFTHLPSLPSGQSAFTHRFLHRLLCLLLLLHCRLGEPACYSLVPLDQGPMSGH